MWTCLRIALLFLVLSTLYLEAKLYYLTRNHFFSLKKRVRMNVNISYLLEKTSFPDLNPPKCALGTSKISAAQTKLIIFYPNLFVLICILTWSMTPSPTQSKLGRPPRLYTPWVLWLPRQGDRANSSMCLDTAVSTTDPHVPWGLPTLPSNLGSWASRWLQHDHSKL